jgi:hypothetical protein
MLAAEDVQRQIAVTSVVAVEERALLVAVQRIIGGIEIQSDPPRQLVVGLEEQIHQLSIPAVRFLG